MRVRAKAEGYFGADLRKPGAEFDIPDEPKGKDGLPVAFSKRWMETVQAPVKDASKAK